MRKKLVLPDKCHPDVILVVLRIVRIGLVDASSHESPEDPRLVFRLRLWRHFDAAQQAVTIVLFRVTGDGQEAAEERQMPDVDEADGDAGVEAEDPDARKRRHDSGQKPEEVGQRRHGDGDGRVTEAEPHSFRHRQLVWRQASPRAEQHVGVVEADAQEEEGRRHVQADELHLSVAAKPETGNLLKENKFCFKVCLLYLRFSNSLGWVHLSGEHLDVHWPSSFELR